MFQIKWCKTITCSVADPRQQILSPSSFVAVVVSGIRYPRPRICSTYLRMKQSELIITNSSMDACSLYSKRHVGNTRRRITVTSSLNEISTSQLRKGESRQSACPTTFCKQFLDSYFKATCTDFPPPRIFAPG
jgi:hypothetical protein